MAVAKLSIDLEARLARLEGDLNRATSLVERQAGRMEKSFSRVGDVLKGFGGLLAGGFAGNQLSQLLRDTGQYADRVERLAALSNQSTQEFQRQAEAARTVGIESDKLADIFKDVQDKVGDFLQNGGGPLKDFFDNIAPRVGVTADQFRRLGGADALQLYVNSLQAANLSQAELTFYLEAIASDSALLLPLLRDNGKAMKELGDQAERAGVVMDEKAIRAAQEFERNVQRLQQSVTGLAREIAGPLINAMNQLFDLQKRGQRSGGGFFSGLGQQLTEDFRRARLTAAQEEVARQRPNFERAQRVLSQQPDSIYAKQVVADFRRAEQAVADYRKQLDDVVFAGAGRRPPNEGGGGFSPPPGMPQLPIPPVTIRNTRAGGASRQTEPRPGPLQGPAIPDDLTNALRRIESTDAARLARLNEELARLVQLASMGDAGAAAALPGLVDDIASLDPAAQAAAKRLEELNSQQQRLSALLGQTPQGKLRGVIDDLAFLNEQFSAGNIQSVEEWADAVRNATQRLGTDVERVDNVGRELGLTFASAAEEAISNFNSLGDVLRGLEQDILRIFTRKLITEPLSDAVGGLLDGVLGGSGGSIFNSASKFLAGLFGSAKGNAFGPAGALAFANGGVVDRPTLFGFGGNRTGLMGEAGPEAILPLRRGRDGKLGVASAGQSRSTTINVTVQAQPGMSRDTALQQGANIGRGIQQALARNG